MTFLSRLNQLMKINSNRSLQSKTRKLKMLNSIMKSRGKEVFLRKAKFMKTCKQSNRKNSCSNNKKL